MVDDEKPEEMFVIVISKTNKDMKRNILTIAILMTCTLIPAGLWAQSNTMTGTAKAEIRKPLVIVDDPLVPAGTNTLNFGIVAPGSAAGTLTLSTTNAKSTTGGVTYSSAVSTSVASFELSGSAGKSYAITLGAASVTINGTSGNALTNAATMTVDGFTVRPASAGADQLTGILDGTTGKDKFAVGGTLHVATTQDEGEYEGTFTIMANYN